MPVGESLRVYEDVLPDAFALAESLNDSDKAWQLDRAASTASARLGRGGSRTALPGRRLNEARETPGAAIWQRNYYEHVVRDEKELAAICGYIAYNPAKWGEDVENPRNV